MSVVIPTKPLFQSKTFWFNVIGVFIYVLNQLGYKSVTPDPVVQGIIQGIINIILRVMTTQGVHL